MSRTLSLAGLLLATMAYIGFGGGGSETDSADDSAVASPDASDDAENPDNPDETDDSVEGDNTEESPPVDPIALSSFSCPDVNPATEIVFVYSVEKEGLMDRVVAGFNQLQPGCGQVAGYAVPSGVHMSRLADNWPAENDDVPPPHIASPSTSLWAIEANALADEQGHSVSVELEDTASLGWVPLVAAMPESVQQQIAPDRTISLEELAELSGRQVGDNDFVLRKNNPEIASTGLMAMLAPYAVATDLDTLTTDTLSDVDEAIALAAPRASVPGKGAAGSGAARSHVGDSRYLGRPGSGGRLQPGRPLRQRGGLRRRPCGGQSRGAGLIAIRKRGRSRLTEPTSPQPVNNTVEITGAVLPVARLNQPVRPAPDSL